MRIYAGPHFYLPKCFADQGLKAGSPRLGDDEGLRRGRDHLVFLEQREQK